MAQAIDMSAIEQALNGFTIPPQPEILQHIQQQLDAHQLGRVDHFEHRERVGREREAAQRARR